jgi:hypothetical protein
MKATWLASTPEFLSEPPLSQAQTFTTSLQEFPEMVGIFHALLSNNPTVASNSTPYRARNSPEP